MNNPYSGGYIIRKYANNKVETLQLELSYKKYIDNRNFVNEEFPKINKKLFGEDLVNTVGANLLEVERVCAANGNLGILKRTMISIQRIWNQTLKDALSRKIFLDEPIGNIDVELAALENKTRK